jgi:hypothetical protein
VGKAPFFARERISRPELKSITRAIIGLALHFRTIVCKFFHRPVKMLPWGFVLGEW